jgi:hypothetical protein
MYARFYSPASSSCPGKLISKAALTLRAPNNFFYLDEAFSAAGPANRATWGSGNRKVVIG